MAEHGIVVRRAHRGQRAGTLHRILDACGDEAVTRLLAMHFTSPLRRLLAFHLAQAPLSCQQYKEIGRPLDERLGSRAAGKLRAGGARHLHHTPVHSLDRLL